jgi:hypothetical protein
MSEAEKQQEAKIDEAKMEQVRFPRTGDSDIRFTGRLVGAGDSSEQDSWRPGLFSHTAEIYETKGGKWIGHVFYKSGRLMNEDNEHTVMIADTAEEPKDKLLDYECPARFATAYAAIIAKARISRQKRK